MPNSRVSRRRALSLGVAAAALPLVHIRTAGAAGKLSIGFWDHWVPAGNDVMRAQVQAWGDKNKVAVEADFITSNGFKNLLTITAEEQAKTGHDIFAFPSWEVLNHQASLEPMDDVMARLTKQYGPTNEVFEYLCKVKGHWLSVPTSSGTQNKGPCGRISVLRDAAGIDVLKMYPASNTRTPEADAWTFDAFLKAAEACQKVNMGFGIGLGTTADSVDFAGALFRAFGASLIDSEGNIKVDSAEMHQVLEYSQKLVKFLPKEAVAYDDASNNRALISGQSALIFNPPSAWASAVKDSPKVAADCWTFPSPTGPKGRFMPINIFSFGVWSFGKNKTAAKELIEFLMQRENVEARDNVTLGYDLPPFASMNDFKVWEDTGPPKGTVFNYPNKPHHNMKSWLAAMDGPPEVAVQIYNRGTMPTMIAKLGSGQSIPQVIAWAKDELEGFSR